MRAVAADHNPVAIARPGGGAVVLVSLSDWRAKESSLSASQAHERDSDQPANA
jgi:prevent-host-death family protein